VAYWAIKGRHAGEVAPALRLGHWAAAQKLTEAWRRDAHQILSEAIIGERTEARQAAGVRLIGYLERVKRESGEARLPRRDVLRALHLTAGALDAAIAAVHGAVREFEERTAGRPARYIALATDAPDEEPPVTKATKAPQEEEAQVTEGSGGLGTDAIGAVTEAGLKVTKVPDARPTPGAAKVNGASHALPDERDGFAVVPAAGGVAVAEDDPEEEDGTWTFSA
jgi:hypothetical protein